MEMTSEILDLSACDISAWESRLLIVGGDEAVATSLERHLLAESCTIAWVQDEAAAMRALTRHTPDLIIIDTRAPDAVALCRRLKDDRATRLTPVLLVAATHSQSERIAAAEAGADAVLLSPIDPEELRARVRYATRLSQYTADLDPASSIIAVFCEMAETREGYDPGHCHRVGNYAASLGRAMELESLDLQTLRRGGFLHDIGMLAIPANVLRKEGPLDADEYQLIQSHTVIGDGLCARLQSLQPIRGIVRHHHERLDGSGYPDGLQGDEIPLLAQIVGIVDVYEALTMPRSYRPEQEPSDALQILREQQRRGWRRADLTDCFISMREQEAEGSGHRGAPVALTAGQALQHEEMRLF
jgi:putative two-component system response regulator